MIVHRESVPPLVHAQVLHACGESAAAREAIAAAAERIRSRAGRVRDPERRRHFLASPDNRHTLDLAREWARDRRRES